MIPNIIIPYNTAINMLSTTSHFNVYKDTSGTINALLASSGDATEKITIKLTNKNNIISINSKTVSIGNTTYDEFNVIFPGPFMHKIAVRKNDSAQTTTEESKEAIEKYDGRRKRLTDVVGREAMKKAESLRVMVWGCGRAGSLLALRLVQDGIGLEGGIVLVDPDNVEDVNLDGTMVFEIAKGKPKAAAVATMCSAFDSNANVFPLIDAFSDRTFDAMISSDIIFTPIDSDVARGNIILAAARYHKPLIDINSGVTKSSNGELQSVAHNTAIFVPGTLGCPICLQRKTISNKALGTVTTKTADEYVKNNTRSDNTFTHSDEICSSVADALHLFWGLILGNISRGMTMTSEYNYRTCNRTHRGEMITGDVNRCSFCNDSNIVGEPIIVHNDAD
ncbi:MAG: thiamine biosynthesis protein ThiF [Firmicutes bacterium ADurb.Bin419]|nr:MAG: thiamine biosynthesis protein ThiF [Firmicutes bacterium ADurb.Bin419]